MASCKVFSAFMVLDCAHSSILSSILLPYLINRLSFGEADPQSSFPFCACVVFLIRIERTSSVVRDLGSGSRAERQSIDLNGGRSRPVYYLPYSPSTRRRAGM
jgi:hypothetical protein